MEQEEVENALQKVKEFARLVEKPIEDYLLATADYDLRDVVLHQTLSGGKRLRPGLVILMCWATGGEPRTAIPAAAAIEILHNYSLVIDDIIDAARVRRNRETTWKRYGLALSILAGVLHREAAFLAMRDSGHFDVIEQLISRSICAATSGQVKDLKYTLKKPLMTSLPLVPKNKMSLEDYNRMIWQKTAQFFGVACKIGVIVANGSREQQEQAQKYGEALGMAFQIMDDILDLKGTTEEFGKEVGKDLKEGKLGNLPLLIAYNQMTLEEQEVILEILKHGASRAGDIQKALQLIKKYEGIKKARIEAEKYTNRAKAAIKDFPNEEAVKILKVLADYVLTRRQ